MKAMKIKLNPGNTDMVRQLLEKNGYNISGVPHNAVYCYTHNDTKDVSYGIMDSVFKGKDQEEHFLLADINGPRFVTKDYWTQPATANIPERYKNPVTDADKATKDAYDKMTGYTETAYEPLPFHLKPRSEFLHERNVDIINVMLEYVTEGTRIPDDIISELTTNNAEIYGNDF